MTAPRLLATTRAMMGTPHPQHRRRTLSAPSAFHDEARPLGIPPVLQMTSVARPPIASTSSMPFVAPMTKADSSSSTESSPEWANVSLPPHDAFQAPATVPPDSAAVAELLRLTSVLRDIPSASLNHEDRAARRRSLILDGPVRRREGSGPHHRQTSGGSVKKGEPTPWRGVETNWIHRPRAVRPWDEEAQNRPTDA